MNRRRARFRPPMNVRSAPTSRTAVGLPLLLAAAATLGACSSQSDTATAEDPATEAADTEAAAGGDGDAATGDTIGDDGYGTIEDEFGETLSFGDPADDGFAEVEDVVPEPEETPAGDLEVLSTPDEVLPEVVDQLETTTIPDGEEILDAVDVVDTEAEVASDRDGRSRNSTGELAVLDDAASLACAHTEVALTQLDDGNASIAIERIWSASVQAAASNISTIQSWEEPLAEVIADGNVADLAPLIGFITVCAEGGYEL